MFHTIDDFEREWMYESASTQKQMDQLTDASLSQAVADGHRTLGHIAGHIVTSIPEIMCRAGLKLSAVDLNSPMPETAGGIMKAYAAVSNELLDRVKADWDDTTLQIEDELFGETWKRGLTLLVLLKHEVHHRGQMTVLMRRAGLKVPGFYGPSKEEWVNQGTEPRFRSTKN